MMGANLQDKKAILIRTIFILGTALAILSVYILVFNPSSVQAVSLTKTIRDNATGGDCTSIGTWNSTYKTCTLTSDFSGTIGIVNNGITLDGAGHTLRGYRPNGGLVFNVDGVTVRNLVIEGFGNGLLVSGGSGHTIVCNTITGNDTGIYIDSSNGNTIAFNTIGNNGTGVFIGDSSGNTVTNNNLLGNSLQAMVSPDGGNDFLNNYFDDFDTPGEGCIDAGGDGYCDTAYVFAGGSDPAPRTSADVCGKPDLRLFKDSTFWNSYADYLADELSVTYSVRNMSSQSAYDLRITSSTGDNGVVGLTGMPVLLGDLAGGGSVSTTIKYRLAAGVGQFISTTTGTSKNACGTLYTYPD